MSSTSPAVGALLRSGRILLRLPLLAWHVLVHLPVVLLLIAFGGIGKHRLDHAAIRWWSGGLLWIFGMRLQQVGEPLPGGTMFVANHVGWVDIVALHSRHMMGFIAKHEIRGWPLVGWLASRAETIYLHRGRTDSLVDVMHEMARRLREGRAVAAFPEAGTLDGSALGPFHARIFAAAVNAEAPVQPVALCYGEGCSAQAQVAFAPGESFLGNFIRLLGEPVRPVRVVFLEPIRPDEADGRRAIAQLARTRVLEAMQEDA